MTTQESAIFLTHLSKLQKHMEKHDCNQCLAILAGMMEALTNCAWWQAYNQSHELKPKEETDAQKQTEREKLLAEFM